MFKLNRKVLLVVLVLSILTLSIAGCSNNDQEAEGDIVATVDGEEITQEEFDRDFNMFRNMYAQELGEEALSQDVGEGKVLEDLLRENVLEKLIVERLVAKDVEELGIEVPEEEVDSQLEMNIESIGGEEGFEEFLKGNGFTKEDYKETLRKEITYQKHEDEFIAETEIPEDEIMEYYEANKEELMQVEVSHIVVETEEEGKAIIDKLEDGEDFAALAETESIDPNSAVEGGKIGLFSKEEQVISSEFMEAAFALEPGKTSDLVETDMGQHIILLDDKKDSYEDLSEQIALILKNDKYVEKIEGLKEQADIKIFMEEDEVEKSAEK